MSFQACPGVRTTQKGSVNKTEPFCVLTDQLYDEKGSWVFGSQDLTNLVE
jgi:hypothetical protein